MSQTQGKIASCKLALRITLKAGLDGSGSHNKRHQLLGDPVDVSLAGSSDSFLGVFMTPLTIHLDEKDSSILLWENPSPNSIFFTMPMHLVKVKESRAFVESIFPDIPSPVLMLCELHTKFQAWL